MMRRVFAAALVASVALRAAGQDLSSAAVPEAGKQAADADDAIPTYYLDKDDFNSALTGQAIYVPGELAAPYLPRQKKHKARLADEDADVIKPKKPKAVDDDMPTAAAPKVPKDADADLPPTVNPDDPDAAPVQVKPKPKKPAKPAEAPLPAPVNVLFNATVGEGPFMKKNVVGQLVLPPSLADRVWTVSGAFVIVNTTNATARPLTPAEANPTNKVNIFDQVTLVLIHPAWVPYLKPAPVGTKMAFSRSDAAPIGAAKDNATALLPDGTTKPLDSNGQVGFNGVVTIDNAFKSNFGGFVLQNASYVGFNLRRANMTMVGEAGLWVQNVSMEISMGDAKVAVGRYATTSTNLLAKVGDVEAQDTQEEATPAEPNARKNLRA